MVKINGFLGNFVVIMSVLSMMCGAATTAPSVAPTVAPTIVPTAQPTVSPSIKPTVLPTIVPTTKPTISPTTEPSVIPTMEPSVAPTISPTIEPTVAPTVEPSVQPSIQPTIEPSIAPSQSPTVVPSQRPTMEPTTRMPTVKPTTAMPTRKPSAVPTKKPTRMPTHTPTIEPSMAPSVEPTIAPSEVPTVEPSIEPSMEPTAPPSYVFVGAQVYIPLVLQGVTVEQVRRMRKLSAIKLEENSRFGKYELNYASDYAIVAVTADTLGLANYDVNIQAEEIDSTVGGLSQVTVHLSVLAEPSDYPGVSLVTTEDIVNQVKNLFYAAIDNGSFLASLSSFADNTDAWQLFTVSSAAAGDVTYYKISTQPDNNHFSTGDFAGIVIGVVVAFLLLVGVVYFIVNGGCGAKSAASSGNGATDV